MDGESKFWYSLWVSLALIAAVSICFLMANSRAHEVEMAKMGYQQTYTYHSAQTGYWVKVEKGTGDEKR